MIRLKFPTTLTIFLYLNILNHPVLPPDRLSLTTVLDDVVLDDVRFSPYCPTLVTLMKFLAVAVVVMDIMYIPIVNQDLTMTMEGMGTEIVGVPITGLQKNQLVMTTRRCVRWRKTSR